MSGSPRGRVFCCTTSPGTWYDDPQKSVLNDGARPSQGDDANCVAHWATPILMDLGAMRTLTSITLSYVIGCSAQQQCRSAPPGTVEFSGSTDNLGWPASLEVASTTSNVMNPNIFQGASGNGHTATFEYEHTVRYIKLSVTKGEYAGSAEHRRIHHRLAMPSQSPSLTSPRPLDLQLRQPRSTAKEEEPQHRRGGCRPGL